MVLVTGGTGFLGSYILYYLLKEHERVRATYRKRDKGEPVDENTAFIFTHLFKTEGHHLSQNEAEHKTKSFLSRIDWQEADLLDTEALWDAAEGVDQIFHSAALVSFNKKRRTEVLRNNIEGTANIVNICLEKNISLFYVSSTAALEDPVPLPSLPVSIQPVNESFISDPKKFHSAYAESKYKSEMEVWRGITEGLNAVIINPGIILGWGDFHRTSLSVFPVFAKGLPFYPSGSNGFVDVRDVAQILIALSKNKEAYGQRFVIVAENLTYLEVFEKIALAFGKKPPRIPVPKMAALTAQKLLSLMDMFSGKEPFATRELIHSSYRKVEYDASKIKNFLHYNFIPLEKTIRDSVEAYLTEKEV